MPPALRAWHSSPQIHVFLENLHQDVPTRVTLIGTSTRASLFLVPLQAHEPGPQRPHRHPSFGTHSQVGKSLLSMHFVICPGGHFVFSGSPAIIGAPAFACLVRFQREPRICRCPPLSHRLVLLARTPLVCLVAWTGSSLGGGFAHRCADELERYFNTLETGWPFRSRLATCGCDGAQLWASIVANQRALSADELERFSNNKVFAGPGLPADTHCLHPQCLASPELIYIR